MGFSIFLLIVIIFLWKLLVEGLLWKIIIGIFGWIGLYTFISQSFHSSKNTCIVFAGSHFSWSIVIPTIILFMAMLYTKE
jgi:hypothetical protein